MRSAFPIPSRFTTSPPMLVANLFAYRANVASTESTRAYDVAEETDAWTVTEESERIWQALGGATTLFVDGTVRFMLADGTPLWSFDLDGGETEYGLWHASYDALGRVYLLLVWDEEGLPKYGVARMTDDGEIGMMANLGASDPEWTDVAGLQRVYLSETTDFAMSMDGNTILLAGSTFIEVDGDTDGNTGAVIGLPWGATPTPTWIHRFEFGWEGLQNEILIKFAPGTNILLGAVNAEVDPGTGDEHYRHGVRFNFPSGVGSAPTLAWREPIMPDQNSDFETEVRFIAVNATSLVVAHGRDDTETLDPNTLVTALSASDGSVLWRRVFPDQGLSFAVIHGLAASGEHVAVNVRWLNAM